MLLKIENIQKSRSRSLHFFETIQCEDCGGKEDLTQNRYSDAIKCLGCLNSLLEAEAEKARAEEARLEEEQEKESYYTDSNYNQLCEERNK